MKIFNSRSVRLFSLTGVTLIALLIGAASASAEPNEHGAPQAFAHAAVCGPAAQGDARCHSRVIVDTNGSPKTNTAPFGYGPAQFRGAYALPSLTAGSGQTIAVVDAYDDPNIASDLNTYSRQFGLPQCNTTNPCFTKVNQTGGGTYPFGSKSWGLEISLDVEIAHAACPNCKILLVEATSNSFTNLLAAEDYAAAHANVVSNSWGAGEFSTETGFDAHFNHPGVPITFSSGDGGYGVEYPASSPYVTAVGGTTLTLNSNTTRANETVWSGAGSGCSAYEPQQSWQTALGLSGCTKNRIVADVSADANPNTGAAVYDSYGYRNPWLEVGGTSLASPLIASTYALAGNETATLYGSYPYANTASLFDVTSGSNGSCSGSYLCTAGIGYDGPTGLGTPNNGVGGF